MEVKEIYVRHNDDEIDLSDIPEITDFSKAIKNPFAGRFKNGYTIIVEHEDHNEIREIKIKRVPKDQCLSTV